MVARSTPGGKGNLSRPGIESQLFVYRTARGLLRSVRAENAYEAWAAASKKRKPFVLFDLSGAAWVESAKGGATRDKEADVEPIWARSFFFDAVAAEIPVAIEEMARAASGKYIAAPALRRMLADRGLLALDGEDHAITDLGRAFVAHHVGGGQ